MTIESALATYDQDISLWHEYYSMETKVCSYLTLEMHIHGHSSKENAMFKRARIYLHPVFAMPDMF